MATPKFITVKGSTSLTSTPYYIGLVQHESIVYPKETYQRLAEHLGKPAAKVRAAFLGLKEFLKNNADRGNITSLDGIASVRNTVHGGFATQAGPWVKGKNYLMPKPVALDPFKSTLSGVVPTNRTEGASPEIKSVLDNVTGTYDVITGTDAFTIAGIDLGPDTTKTDEYVGVINAAGMLTKATVESSDLNKVKAAFATALTAGEYTLVVATRSGLGEEYGVATATRKIEIA